MLTRYCEAAPRWVRVMRWAEGRSKQGGGEEEPDEFTFESTRVLRRFVEQLDLLWKPVFGFDLPLQRIKSTERDGTVSSAVPTVRL